MNIVGKEAGGREAKVIKLDYKLTAREAKKKKDRYDVGSVRSRGPADRLPRPGRGPRDLVVAPGEFRTKYRRIARTGSDRGSQLAQLTPN